MFSLVPPRRGGSNEYTQSLCSEQKYEKYQNFLSENFPYLVVKFSIYLNRHVFLMRKQTNFDRVVSLEMYQFLLKCSFICTLGLAHFFFKINVSGDYYGFKN